MSFLSRLFGGKGSGREIAAETATATEEYKGFTITAMPRPDQGQYLCAGSVQKLVDGVVKQHAFVRADRSPNRDEITATALMKGRLMIDQQGDALFS